MYRCYVNFQVVNFSFLQSVAPNNVSSEYSVLSCEDNVFTKSIISYLMILISYALAFYTFRVAEPEHLSSLTERVSCYIDVAYTFLFTLLITSWQIIILKNDRN